MIENNSHETDLEVAELAGVDADPVDTEPAAEVATIEDSVMHASSQRPKEVVWGDGRKPDPARICSKHRTNGEPCRKTAVRGTEPPLCMSHGAAASAVRRKARLRLEMAADRMAKELLGIAENDDAPPAVKLAAIRDALDRAGLSAKTAVEIEVGPSKPFEDLLTDMISGGSRAESRARRNGDDAESAVPEWIWEELDIVEAEVVDEPEDHEPLIPRERPVPEREHPSVATDFVSMEDGLEALRPHQPTPPRPRRPWGRTRQG